MEEPVHSRETGTTTEPELTLLYFPAQEGLAQRIAACAPDSITLGSIRWATFPDGFPNVKINDALSLRNERVVFLAALDDPANLFIQLSVIYTLPRLFPASFTLLVPFFATGTTEQMHEEGQLVTAYSLSRLLSDIPRSKGGPISVGIVDMHSLHERFYFHGNAVPSFVSSMPLLLERLQALKESEQKQGAEPAGASQGPTDGRGEGHTVMLCFPDVGASKRFGKQLQGKGFPLLYCVKERLDDGMSCEVRLQRGSPSPTKAHVVIVDDITRTGCTLLAARRMLFALGASRVSAYVTHAPISQDSDIFPRLLQPEPVVASKLSENAVPTCMADGRGFALLSDGGRLVNVGNGGYSSALTLDDSYRSRHTRGQQYDGAGFTRIWITDTVPSGAAAAQALSGPSPFEVLTAAPLLAEIALSVKWISGSQRTYCVKQWI